MDFEYEADEDFFDLEELSEFDELFELDRRERARDMIEEFKKYV